MAKHRILAKRKAAEYLDKELSRQASFISDFLGVPSRRVFTYSERRRFRAKFLQWVDIVFDTFTADWNKLSTTEQLRRIQVLLERQIHLVARVPINVKAVDWVLGETELASSTYHGSQGLQKSYRRYAKATGWLMGKLFKEGRIGDAQKFFSDFVRSEEAISLGQIYALQVLPRYAFLNRVQRKALGPRDVRKLIELFGLLFGLYEKLLRLLLVANRICKGKPVTYEDVRRMRTFEIENELTQEPALRPLVPRGNRPIRNAIVHPQNRILHSEKRVRFTNGKQVDVTWKQLRGDTVELSVLLLALAFSPILHYLRMSFQPLSKVFRESKDSLSQSDK